MTSELSEPKRDLRITIIDYGPPLKSNQNEPNRGKLSGSADDKHKSKVGLWGCSHSEKEREVARQFNHTSLS